MVFLPGSLPLCTPLFTLEYLISLGLRERESLNGCSLVFLSSISPLQRSFCFSPVPVYYRETTGDHVIFNLLKVYSPELPRRVLCLPSSEQPLSWPCAFSLESTCVEALTTGQEMLLCCLYAPSVSAVIDFKMPLLPLPGSTGQGIWMGGVGNVEGERAASP